MVDRLDGPLGLMVDRLDRLLLADRLVSEMLRGFCDRQTDICDCRVTFAPEN